MAGENPALIVRVAANLEELKRNLAEGRDHIETTTAGMQKLATSFSGERLIQQAHNVVAAVDQIGGASKLTAAEQERVNSVLDRAIEKYTALGRTAPPAMVALAEATKHVEDQTHKSIGGFLEGIPIVEAYISALSAERVFEFVKGVVESTARLEDLHLATGISREGLQQLQFVGKEFGVDLEQMARGVEQVSAKLANGDANATKAVQMLGLSVKELIAAGPEEAFLQIAEAVGRVEDPMLKNGLAAELFGGKLAKVLIPMLGELRKKMEEVPKDAIISDRNVERAHDFEVGLEHLAIRGKAWTATIVEMITHMDRMGPIFLDQLGVVRPTTEAIDEHAAAVEHDTQATTTSADLLNNRLTALRTAAVAPLTSAQKENIEELLKYGVSMQEVAQLTGTTEIAVKLFADGQKVAAEAAKKAAEEQKKYADSMTELMSAGKGWQGTLDTLSGSVVEAIKFYLAAGVAQADLARIYGLTATQVRAVASELTAETAAQTKAAEEAKKTAATVKKAAEDWANVLREVSGVGQQFGSVLDTIDGSIVDWAEHLLKSGVSAKVVADYYGLTDTQVRALQTDLANTQKSWDAETKALEKAAGSVRTLSGEYITLEEQKKRASQSFSTQVDLSTQAGRDAVDPKIATWLHQGYSLAQASAIAFDLAWGIPINQNDPLFRQKGPAVPGFAEGVQNFSGGLAVVGERGPELLQLPPGSNVYPHGSGSAMTTTLTVAPGAVVINYPIMDNPRARAEIADQVGTAIIRRLTAAGFRVPSGA